MAGQTFSHAVFVFLLLNLLILSTHPVKSLPNVQPKEETNDNDASIDWTLNKVI